MPHLQENHYGKTNVRLLKLARAGETHEVREWNVALSLTGDFDACFLAGDNTGLMATDTMKNTVYSVARNSSALAMEEFALELAGFIRDRNPQLATITITIAETMWMRMKANGIKQGSAFIQRGPDVATTILTLPRTGAAAIHSGIEGLVILKTSNSGFSGFYRDELTTLPDTADRLLGTAASIVWHYATLPDDFASARARMMDTLLTTFAQHESLSVQHTLYAMAEAALEALPEISEIHLTMPNRHNIPFDFSRFQGQFKQDNPNLIFIPTDEPSGHIHARVTR